MSDYLWNRQGEVDPEVARLEALLGPLRYRRAAPRPRRPRTSVYVAVVYVAVVSGVAAAAAIAIALARPWRAPAPPRPTMAQPSVTPSTETPARVASPTRQEAALGEWIDTATARHLRVGDLGAVDLEPGTRARLVASGGARYEVELARGTLTAVIDAPPRRFAVLTPRARITDLGCAFRVTVGEDGRGAVTVSAGRVGVSSDGGRELIVAAGGVRAFGAPPEVETADKTPRQKTAHDKAPREKTPRPKTPAAGPRSPSAKTKNNPDSKLNHDSLKALQQSIE